MNTNPNSNGKAPGGRVLIVDDELANIQVLAEALGSDYDIRFATGGVRALELAMEQPVDVILLDVVMPDMDGFEVLRWLKSEARTRHVPVIFVTSMDESAEEERGFALGAVDYVVKPVSPAIVRARVRTHIELKRQRDLLEEHAALDGLTGIANRRRFEAELDQRWRAAQRAGGGLMLLLADVDHFKQYNDNYGHGPGDDCLRRVAAALASAFSRGDDFVARYGGEEFVLLLPAGEAGAQIQRLLLSVSALAIPHAYSSAGRYVSLSVGALELKPAPGDLPQVAMEAVDGLLYQAKREGRDRCAYRLAGESEVRTMAPGDPV
ncbi:diguanylate cyclase domain-containing protein [Arenimonas sp.]|uniref:diguanylate cyclase domain-containing protein n=1 Tax=Arenimonas sp. TaxID=1872635 RepID=UPI0039E44AC3